MKKLLLIVVVVLAGCSSLQNAGMVEYSIKPIVTAQGDVICCEAVVRNGKEYGQLKAKVKKTGGDYEVTLEETGVAAFQGQQISSDALKGIVDAAVKAALAGAGVGLLP